MSIIYQKRDCLYCKQKRRMYQVFYTTTCKKCNMEIYYVPDSEKQPLYRMDINLLKGDRMTLVYFLNEKRVLANKVYIQSDINYGIPDYIENVNSFDEFKRIVKKYRKFSKLKIFE